MTDRLRVIFVGVLIALVAAGWFTAAVLNSQLDTSSGALSSGSDRLVAKLQGRIELNSDSTELAVSSAPPAIAIVTGTEMSSSLIS